MLIPSCTVHWAEQIPEYQTTDFSQMLLRRVWVSLWQTSLIMRLNCHLISLQSVILELLKKPEMLTMSHASGARLARNSHSEISSQTDLQHERVWWVDEDGGVFPGRWLQAELGICGLGVVGEGDGAGQLAIVQHLLVVLSQVDVALWLKLESALQRGRKRGS